jgi:hypothetical protein
MNYKLFILLINVFAFFFAMIIKIFIASIYYKKYKINHVLRFIVNAQILSTVIFISLIPFFEFTTNYLQQIIFHNKNLDKYIQNLWSIGLLLPVYLLLAPTIIIICEGWCIAWLSKKTIKLSDSLYLSLLINFICTPVLIFQYVAYNIFLQTLNNKLF